MNNIVHDVLGNALMFSVAYIIVRKTPKRKYFIIRAASCFAVLCLWRYVFFFIIRPDDPVLLKRVVDMIGFVSVFLIVSASVWICFDCDIWTGLFCGSGSYIMQHICQRMYSISSAAMLDGQGQIWHILLYVAFMAVTLAIMYLLMKRLKIEIIIVDNTRLLVISIVIVATTVVLDLIMYYALFNDMQLMEYCIYLVGIFLCALTLALQFGMVVNKRVRMERDTIKQMLEEEREQYYFEKSMIDIVNIKCHDLKHNISVSDGSDAAAKEETKAAVDAYDSSFKTGNIALDVVLTRKNFSCKEKEIELTCAVCGDCLSFMSEVDIYSLFGNILDNAIDACERIDNKTKRVVSLAITRKDYFVFIHAENYFEGRLVFADGLPKTTKKDTGMHGYGLKSIRMLAEKYGGNIKIGVIEDRFQLDIMFPI